MKSEQPLASGSAWRRFHAAFMPDYNPRAALYWWTISLVGATTIVSSLVAVAGQPLMVALQIAVGIVVASLAGLVPVRIPGTKNSFAAGEVFIFLLLLLYGVPAATLAAASEALIGSWRTSKRWTSRLGSPCMAAASMFAAASLFEAIAARLGGFAALTPVEMLVGATAFSLAYFALNTVFVGAVAAFKRSEPLRVDLLIGMFGLIGFTFAGSAVVAALLYFAYRDAGIGVLTAAVPVIGMLLMMLHYFFRQQEADASAQRGRIEAAEREAAQSALHLQEFRKSEERFHSAFTHASIGMALVAFDGRILQANRALTELLGQAPGSMTDRQFTEFVDTAHLEGLDAGLRRLESGAVEACEMETVCHGDGGRPVSVALSASIFAETGSAAPCFIVQVLNIEARLQAQQQLQHIAFHDSLTGLPNRRRMHELLAQAVERSRAPVARPFALMFLDFDRFKLINDSLGHAAGDQLLRIVARRIENQLRPGDVVARMGGDEFAVLLTDAPSQQGTTALAERLLEAMAQSIGLNGVQVSTSASIGITFSAMGYASAEDALRDADTAMYQAKADGKARYALFDAGLHLKASHRLRLGADLRQAIAQKQLTLVYQPLVHLESGRISGFEALLRWTHPEFGLVPPATFIPLAEEAGLIVAITDFVLHGACRQMADWQQRHPSQADVGVQVNVSAHDFAQGKLVQRVKSALQGARLLPQHLTLELTENVLLERFDEAVGVLSRLRELGLHTSIDDFGTGYSSLSYLARLPVDSLKIDASFVRGLRPGSDEAEVLRAITVLGNVLGKEVVVEGIETDSQLAELRNIGCTTGQGFHLFRPLEVPDVERLLEGLSGQAWQGLAPSHTAPLMRH